MLAVAPSGELGPAPAGALPFFALQHAPSGNGVYQTVEAAPSWPRRSIEYSSQPQLRPSPFSTDSSLWPKTTRNNRSEKANSSWHTTRIEDVSLHASCHSSSQPLPSAVGSGSTDQLVAAAAAKLVSIAEMEEGTEPSAPPTGELTPDTAEHYEDDVLDDSCPLDENTEEELATLVALTGDPMAWDQVMFTGHTYNRADAGMLLENLGSMADQSGRIHSHRRISSEWLERFSVTMQTPFHQNVHAMPLVPAPIRPAPHEGSESTLTNESSIIAENSVDDSAILSVREAAEAEMLSRVPVAEQPESPTFHSGHSAIESALALVSRLFHPFAAAAQDDAHELSLPDPATKSELELDAAFFKPFAAADQGDCHPGMVTAQSDSTAKGTESEVDGNASSNILTIPQSGYVSGYGTLTPGSRYSPSDISLSINGHSPFLTRTTPSMAPIPPASAFGYGNALEISVYPGNDRLDSIFDASLILPEPVGLESSIPSAFAPASKVHFDELSPKATRSSRDYGFRPLNLQTLETAHSAAQSRVYAISHQLLDIAATMTPNASAALRTSSVLVVPVMPASIFDHSIGSKPCFEASPPSPGNIAYLLVSVVLLLGLIASAIAEHYLTIQ